MLTFSEGFRPVSQFAYLSLHIGGGGGGGGGEGSILPLLVLSYQQHQPLVFSLSAFGSKLDEMKPVNFSSVVS